jgi:carbonic anhydrase/acetyltransferase-like protein (isoleucine patch superfamily)
VTVGHNATIEGCRIGDNSLIGIGAVVLQFVEIGERSLIAANSVVLEQTKIPPRSLVVGAPAKVKKELTGRALDWTEFAVKDYHEIHARYRAQGIDQLRPSE